MSSSDNCPTDGSQEPASVELDENKGVELIIKYKHLLTKIESGFAGITKEFMKHLGKEFADSTLKSLLECAICKEIIIGAVSRGCMHSFCHRCLTNWFKRSTNCPICRDEVCLTVKNPLLDQFIDLFVDLTFTEDEKSERSSLIQQRSIPSTDATKEAEELVSLLEQVEVLDPSLATSIVARNVGVMHARNILRQIFNGDQFNQLLEDDNCDFDKLSIMKELFTGFSDDFDSLKSVFDSFSQLLKAR